jgi:hypothetical protein
MTFGPTMSRDGATANSVACDSSGEFFATSALVASVMLPAGMFRRFTSTPLTYTTAPSSHTTDMLTARYAVFSVSL